MKTSLILAAIAFLAAGCTTWDASTGKLFTAGDNDGLDAVAPNGAHLHIDHNHHSPIIHAYGSSVGRGIGAAGAAIMGYTYAKEGMTMAGAAVGAVPSITNRQTNRATPTPAPATQRPQ